MKQVLLLILIPLIVIGLVVFVALNLDAIQLNATTDAIFVIGGSGIGILLSIVIILALTYAKGTISFDHKTIWITLDKTSLLFRKKEISFGFEQIANASMDEDNYGNRFIILKLRNPSKTINLSSEIKDSNEELIAFWDAFEQQINQYNEANIDQPSLAIRKKSFYQQGWMKALAIISVIAAIAFTILKVVQPDSVSIWRLLLFYIYAIPFGLSVYIANKKNKENK